MKIGSLIAGIILLIIAVLGFTSTSTSISESQSFLGQVERGLSEDARTTHQVNQYAQLGFGVLGVIGLGLVIYGAAASGTKKESMFYCKYCGFPAQSYSDVQQHMQGCSKKPESGKHDDIKNLGILKERLAKGEITKKRV